MIRTNKTEDGPVPSKNAAIFSLAVVIAAICALAANRLWHQDISVTHENRLMENTQVFFLMLATAMHFVQTVRQPTSFITVRQCHMVLGMLCLSIMVREVDIDRLGPQQGWETTETLIRLAGGAVWIWLLTQIFGNRLALWRYKADILWTATSVQTGLGVMFYIASWFFDKSIVDLPGERSQLWEETLQISATVFLFTAALRPLYLKTD